MFTAADLSAMQETQGEHMMDRCVWLHYDAGATDEYGKPVPQWTEGESMACGLDLRPALRGEHQPFGAQQPAVDAVLRLPYGVVMSTPDRVRVTHRFGVMLPAPLTFEVTGPVGQGPSGAQVGLTLRG